MAAKLFFFVVVPILLLWMFVLWLLLPPGSTILLAVFLIGAVVFLWGFKAYREFRILEDTPVIAARSVSMGFSRLKGKATGEDRLVSPLTNQPCYYFRVQVGKWEQNQDQDGDKSGWADYKPKTEGQRFYLDDGTGRVLVDPHGAEFDVAQTCYIEFGPHSKNTRYVDPSLGVPGPEEQELRVLFAANPTLMKGWVQSTDGPLVKPGELSPAKVGRIDPRESYRITEHCLLADRECTVLGTCAENPSPKDEHDRNMIVKGVNEKTFLITTQTERQEEKRLRRSAALRVLVGAAIMIAVTAVALEYR